MPDPDEILPRTAWTDYSGGTMDHTWSDALTSDTRLDKNPCITSVFLKEILIIKFDFQQAKEDEAQAGIGAIALAVTHWRHQGRTTDICFHRI